MGLRSVYTRVLGGAWILTERRQYAWLGVSTPASFGTGLGENGWSIERKLSCHVLSPERQSVDEFTCASWSAVTPAASGQRAGCSRARMHRALSAREPFLPHTGEDLPILDQACCAVVMVGGDGQHVRHGSSRDDLSVRAGEQPERDGRERHPHESRLVQDQHRSRDLSQSALCVLLRKTGIWRGSSSPG